MIDAETEAMSEDARASWIALLRTLGESTRSIAYIVGDRSHESVRVRIRRLVAAGELDEPAYITRPRRRQLPIDPMTSAEQQAIRSDAEQRLEELRTVERALRPDIDDCGEVMSEWTMVCSQIRCAEQQLADLDEAA